MCHVPCHLFNYAFIRVIIIINFIYIAQFIHKMQHKVLNKKADNHNIYDKTIKTRKYKKKTR